MYPRIILMGFVGAVTAVAAFAFFSSKPAAKSRAMESAIITGHCAYIPLSSGWLQGSPEDTAPEVLTAIHRFEQEHHVTVVSISLAAEWNGTNSYVNGVYCVFREPGRNAP